MLPSNTEQRELSSLVQPVRRSVQPSKMDPNALYVLLEHIPSKTGLLRAASVNSAEVKSPKYAFESGDVLFGKLRPGLRKCVVAPGPGYCSQDIVPLRPAIAGSSFLLAALLRSEGFAGQVSRLLGGANLPRVGVPDLLRVSVPWPNEGDLLKLEALAQMTHSLREQSSALSLQIDNFELALMGAVSPNQASRP